MHASQFSPRLSPANLFPKTQPTNPPPRCSNASAPGVWNHRRRPSPGERQRKEVSDDEEASKEISIEE
jgi:hypothetical protein